MTDEMTAVEATAEEDADEPVAFSLTSEELWLLADLTELTFDERLAAEVGWPNAPEPVEITDLINDIALRGLLSKRYIAIDRDRTVAITSIVEALRVALSPDLGCVVIGLGAATSFPILLAAASNIRVIASSSVSGVVDFYVAPLGTDSVTLADDLVEVLLDPEPDEPPGNTTGDEGGWVSGILVKRLIPSPAAEIVLSRHSTGAFGVGPPAESPQRLDGQAITATIRDFLDLP